jgi:hypothetical protein
LKAILVFLEKFSLIFFEPTTDAIEKYGISHGLLVTVIRKPTSCRKRRAPGEHRAKNRDPRERPTSIDGTANEISKGYLRRA